VSTKANPTDFGRIAQWHAKRRRAIRGKSWRARALRAERFVRDLRAQLARLRSAGEGSRPGGKLLDLVVRGRATGDEVTRREAQEG